MVTRGLERQLADELSEKGGFGRFCRNVVAASSHPFGDAVDGEIGRRQPEEDEMSGIAGCDELPQPGRKRPGRERRLESETDALRRELAEAREHHSAGSDRHALGVESRQAAGDNVRIDELVDPSAPCTRAGATVDLPAPSGPARTTTLGRGALIQFAAAASAIARFEKGVHRPTIWAARAATFVARIVDGVADAQPGVPHRQHERLDPLLVAAVLLARLYDALHLLARERQRRTLCHLWRLQGNRGVLLDPAGLVTEAEQCAKPFEILRRVQRAVGSGLPELTQRVDGELTQGRDALIRAPGEQTVIEQMTVLPHRLPSELSRFTVGEELRDSLRDRWDLRLDQPDLARFGPAVDELSRCVPRREVERLADLLAAERAVDVNRALAPTVAGGGVRTALDVTPDEPSAPWALGSTKGTY
jgi:hypothetical protein